MVIYYFDGPDRQETDVVREIFVARDRSFYNLFKMATKVLCLNFQPLMCLNGISLPEDSTFHNFAFS